MRPSSCRSTTAHSPVGSTLQPSCCPFGSSLGCALLTPDRSPFGSSLGERSTTVSLNDLHHDHYINCSSYLRKAVALPLSSPLGYKIAGMPSSREVSSSRRGQTMDSHLHVVSGVSTCFCKEAKMNPNQNANHMHLGKSSPLLRFVFLQLICLQ